MQSETNSKAEIVAVLDDRLQVCLENIRQFILDLDERDRVEGGFYKTPEIPGLSADLAELMQR